jgi:galactose-1-phosphate uridylyltransferase
MKSAPLNTIDEEEETNRDEDCQLATSNQLSEFETQVHTVFIHEDYMDVKMNSDVFNNGSLLESAEGRGSINLALSSGIDRSKNQQR